MLEIGLNGNDRCFHSLPVRYPKHQAAARRISAKVAGKRKDAVSTTPLFLTFFMLGYRLDWRSPFFGPSRDLCNAPF